MDKLKPFQIRTAKEFLELNQRIEELMEQRTQSAKGAMRVAAHLRMNEATVKAGDALAEAIEQAYLAGNVPDAVVNACIIFRTQQRAGQHLIQTLEGGKKDGN